MIDRDRETLHLMQASMQHTDRRKHQREDIRDALQALPDAVGFTELNGYMRRFLKKECKRRGYFFTSNGTVGIAVHPSHRIVDVSGVLVLPGFRSPSGKGSYRARPIVEVTFQTPECNIITVHEAHWITDGPGNRRRTGHRREQSREMVERVRLHGMGRRLSFYMGDTNEDEVERKEREVQNTMERGDLVSIYDALNKWPNTHGRKTIDVIGHYEHDGRVKPESVTAHRRGHSDHRRVSAFYSIRP